MNNFINSIFGNTNTNNNRRSRGGGTNRSYNNNTNNNDRFNFFSSSNFSQQQQETNPNQGPPPTATYILNRLKETCLNLDDINNGNKNCTICFEIQHVGDLAIKLPCGHCYHKKCVWPWLLKHCTCPVCRYELTANNGNEAMSRKEKSDRERLQAQRDKRQREQENELRRKRERLANLEKNEATIKRTKNSKSNKFF